MIPALQAIINFLAAATGDEAKEKWPKGPTVPYRKKPRVPLADYVSWLKAIEDSEALGSQPATHLVQRIRRLYFSDFTIADKGQTAELADDLMDEVIPDAEPPLTTDHVPLDVVNGLFGTSSVLTARGIEVDIGHIWMPADHMVNGGLYLAHLYLDSADIPPLISWAGDLASAYRDFQKAFRVLPAAERTTANGKAMIVAQINGLASKDDLLGDLDGIVLATRWESLSTFVVSKEIEDYYKDDAKPQAQAKLIDHPNSARRFHWFVKMSVPSIPATGKDSSPPDVTLDLPGTTTLLQQLLLKTTADVSKRAIAGLQTSMTEAGQAEFDQLCARFADFLKVGLRDGDAPWPPAPW